MYFTQQQPQPATPTNKKPQKTVDFLPSGGQREWSSTSVGVALKNGLFLTANDRGHEARRSSVLSMEKAPKKTQLEVESQLGWYVFRQEENEVQQQDYQDLEILLVQDVVCGLARSVIASNMSCQLAVKNRVHALDAKDKDVWTTRKESRKPYLFGTLR